MGSENITRGLPIPDYQLFYLDLRTGEFINESHTRPPGYDPIPQEAEKSNLAAEAQIFLLWRIRNKTTAATFSHNHVQPIRGTRATYLGEVGQRLYANTPTHASPGALLCEIHLKTLCQIARIVYPKRTTSRILEDVSVAWNSRQLRTQNSEGSRARRLFVVCMNCSISS